MNHRAVSRSAIAWIVLTLVAAAPAQAQLGDLTWTFGAGGVIPIGTFDDYFEHGATVFAEAAWPLQERVDLTVGVDWDHYNSHAYYGTPNLNQWRFQAGLLADLLGMRAEGFTVEGNVRAGLSSMSNQEQFWLESSTLGVVVSRDLITDWSKTGFGGSAGFRLRFGGDSRLNGFVGIQGNWAQLGADATETLRQTEPCCLGELTSAVSYSIYGGFSFGP